MYGVQYEDKLFNYVAKTFYSYGNGIIKISWNKFIDLGVPQKWPFVDAFVDVLNKGRMKLALIDFLGSYVLRIWFVIFSDPIGGKESLGYFLI